MASRKILPAVSKKASKFPVSNSVHLVSERVLTPRRCPPLLPSPSASEEIAHGLRLMVVLTLPSSRENARRSTMSTMSLMPLTSLQASAVASRAAFVSKPSFSCLSAPSSNHPLLLSRPTLLKRSCLSPPSSKHSQFSSSPRLSRPSRPSSSQPRTPLLTSLNQPSKADP